MRTGSCNWQRGIPNPRLPNPTPALLSLRALPLFRERLATLLQRGSPRPQAPTSVAGGAAGILATRNGQGQGIQEGSSPSASCPTGTPVPASRVPSPRRALTLRRASGGGNGVPGPEGAQQRAQGCRTAGAPPATAAHPAGGPQSGAGAAGRRRRGGTGRGPGAVPPREAGPSAGRGLRGAPL